MPRELVLAHAQRLREQPRGAAVEHREIAREEHDAGRIAVAPLDAGVAGVDHHPHGLLQHASAPVLSAVPCAAPRRAGSLRR